LPPRPSLFKLLFSSSPWADIDICMISAWKMMYSATSITSLFAWPSFQMPCCVLQSVQWSNVFLKHTVKEAAFKKLLMKLSGNANIHHRYLSFILRKPEEFFSKHLAVSSFVPVRQEVSSSGRHALCVKQSLIGEFVCFVAPISRQVTKYLQILLLCLLDFCKLQECVCCCAESL